jgi:hypothetical protein
MEVSSWCPALGCLVERAVGEIDEHRLVIDDGESASR